MRNDNAASLAMGNPICEAHPWLSWPHHDCLAPGMLRSELDTLHERAEILPTRDLRAFLRLLFAVRADDGPAVQAALRDLEGFTPDPHVDGPRG